MKERIIIVGLGETSELAYGYFTYDSDYEVVAFSAEKEFVDVDTKHNLPVVPLEKLTESFSPTVYKVFVAVSSTQLNTLRERLFLKCKEMGFSFVSYVSSRAYVGFGVELGENCFIMEHNTIQPFCKIGNNVVLWSGNHIGHSSVIHDNCFVSSHVVISGFCEVGRNCFLGVNVSVANNLKIGDFCLIGMGSIIARNIENDSIYRMPYAQKYPMSAKQFYHID